MKISNKTSIWGHLQNQYKISIIKNLVINDAFLNIRLLMMKFTSFFYSIEEYFWKNSYFMLNFIVFLNMINKIKILIKF